MRVRTRRSPFFGGTDSHGKPLNAVETFNPETNRWSHLTTLPQARRGLAAVTEDINGNMLAGGIGPGGRVLHSAMELLENLPKHGDHTWRPLAPVHVRRYDFALAVGKGQSQLCCSSNLVYAIGGFGPGHTALRSIEAYSFLTNRWVMKTPMPTARGGLVAQVSDDGRLITVVGGFDGNGHALKTVEQYNVATNRWTTLSPMPTARGGLALVNTNSTSRPGRFALGGRDPNGAALASVVIREAPPAKRLEP